MLSTDLLIDLLFHRTATWLVLLAGVTALVLMLGRWHVAVTRWSGVLLWIAAFTLYDVFGYDFLAMTDSTGQDTMQRLPELRPAYEAAVHSYRIVQVTFQIVLTGFVALAAGRRAAIAALLLWWGGCCDLLYYALTFKPLPALWNWMWFTPLGLFQSELSLTVVIAQAAVLCTAAVIVMTWGATLLVKPRINPFSRNR
ncbi:MAG TPA: hypothetical protein PK916_13435 [Bacteroidota bacterium]|nr:hypothetical protein [Bacteroidota bacterium]